MRGNHLLAFILLLFAVLFFLLAAIPEPPSRLNLTNVGWAYMAGAAAALVWG